MAAEMHRPLPDGVTSLGWFEAYGPLPKVAGTMYVIADDGRDREATTEPDTDARRIDVILAARPDLEVIARFDRPGTPYGVSVLRTR
jgi:hypothetical protein